VGFEEAAQYLLNVQPVIASPALRLKPEIQIEPVDAGRLAGSKRGLIDRGEKKTLDEGARKWCSRLDENRSSEAAEPG
jgi:hypothetical protein